ncbi:MAG: response regulator [Campylobacterales bacterium]
MYKNNVLIVDDNVKNIQVAASTLKDAQIPSVFAKSGKEALEKLKENKISLILMDVMMPVMDGFETTRIIKEDSELSNIPVIFVTAKSEYESVVEGFRSGGVDYITKPYNSEELKARVKTHLELKEYQDRLEERVKEETEKRVEHERELIQNSKMAAMGDMLGAITHQWQQPLNVISMVSDFIYDDYMDGTLDEESLKRDTDAIINQVMFLSQTINDFREFFKPNKQKTSFRLSSETKKIVSMLQPQLKHHNIEVDIKIEKELMAYGYPNEYKQVVLNLLNNARDAITEHLNLKKEQGQIIIGGEDSSSHTQIYIEDNGGGISDEIKERLFDKYESTKGDKGTGLGLSLSKTIIQEHHKGRIYAVDKEGGARFVIELPKESK